MDSQVEDQLESMQFTLMALQGATVRNEGEAVVIGRIVKGGAAARTGLLHEGDEILDVNGISMRGKNVNDVCDILAGMTGTLEFIISPARTERAQPQPTPTPVVCCNPYIYIFH